MVSSVKILIPARLGSTRLPNKPLADINGQTMIVRVCNQAVKSGYKDIIVACSEIEVKDIVEQAGYQAIMTDPHLPSGTDRIYAALQQLSVSDMPDIIVNLQGDLPNINPEVISKTIDVLNNNIDADIATAVVEIRDNSLKNDNNVVKAVVNFSQHNMAAPVYYFSRATVPYGVPKLYEHIGIYVYRRKALEKFINLEPSYFEKYEKLEQLRAIENGLKIYACEIPYDLKPISIDTQDDLDKILSNN